MPSPCSAPAYIVGRDPTPGLVTDIAVQSGTAHEKEKAEGRDSNEETVTSHLPSP